VAAVIAFLFPLVRLALLVIALLLVLGYLRLTWIRNRKEEEEATTYTGD